MQQYSEHITYYIVVRIFYDQVVEVNDIKILSHHIMMDNHLVQVIWHWETGPSSQAINDHDRR